MGNRRFHSTGKGSPPPYRQGKVRPQAVFGEIILAGGSGISEKPCAAGVWTFWSLWNEIPGSNH